MILVDTSVWIEWSNDKASRVASELDRLLGADEVATTDPVMAELLQGARSRPLFDAWLGQLDALHYLPVTAVTWLGAAELSYELRRKGLATALSDLLIAQVAIANQMQVFATDTDFQRVPELELYQF